MVIYDICDGVKRYPGQATPVNDRITLQIGAGEICGILDDHGAGKSTLVRQMVNLLASSSGSIRFLGQEVSTIPTGGNFASWKIGGDRSSQRSETGFSHCTSA